MCTLKEPFSWNQLYENFSNPLILFSMYSLKCMIFFYRTNWGNRADGTKRKEHIQVLPLLEKNTEGISCLWSKRWSSWFLQYPFLKEAVSRKQCLDKQAVWINLLYWNDFTDTKERKKWFLPTPGLVAVSHKIKSFQLAPLLQVLYVEEKMSNNFFCGFLKGRHTKNIKCFIGRTKNMI